MAGAKRTWLVKSEPSVYPFSRLVEDGTAVWDGVRNYEARNNLRAMKKGDILLFYHSGGEGKEVVGLASVKREAVPDPTAAPGEDWAAVEIAPLGPLKEPVSLARVKATPALSKMQLVTKSRISVVPVTSDELEVILSLGKTTLPRGRARRGER